MMKKMALLFVVMALSVAFAETYKVSLWQPALLGGTELKAGNYKVDVTDSKVVFTQGKNADADEARAMRRKVWKRNDVNPTSSCYCEPGRAA